MGRHQQHDYAPYWETALVEGIKGERLAQGMTQAELAERMSDLGYRFHQATVYKIENRERKVSASELWGIAEILDVDVDKLYNWERARGSEEARRKLIRTQADRVLQELLALDDSALRLRLTHSRFVETVREAQSAGMTEHRTVNHVDVPIADFYGPILHLSVHNELLWRLRAEIWTDNLNADFNTLAGDISGIVGLGDMDLTDAVPSPAYHVEMFQGIPIDRLESENWHFNHQMPDAVFERFWQRVQGAEVTNLENVDG